jgi:isopentenyl-diphosphate delta-isomerase
MNVHQSRGFISSDPSGPRRKEQAIEIILRDAEADRNRRYFDRIQLWHRALPEYDLEDVDTSVEFLGRTLALPLLISSMTGGRGERLRRINHNLARAAELCGVAMGVGSQRVMIEHPETAASFDLRPVAPTTVLLSNLGAVQLNYGYGIEQCRRVVEHLRADALIFHCNPLQEAVQPEGQTRLGGLVRKIGAIAAELPVPVVVKEVGAGVSPADAEALWTAGIRILDVAGAGGTSWSRIEGHRRRAAGVGDDLGQTFQDWGVPTPIALRALAPFRERGMTLIASGGIRSGVDMVKAMALGASLVGVARPFLAPAMESAERVVELIRRFEREFRVALWLTGLRSARELIGRTDLLLPRELEDGT